MDMALLKSYIAADQARTGRTLEDIAAAAGMTADGLKARITGREEFRASQMQALCDTLNMSAADRERVFF